MYQIALVLLNVLWFLQIAVLARVILSWFDPHPRHPLLRSYVGAIDALARPLRVVIPVGGVGLDLGPLFLLLIIEALHRLGSQIALMFFR